MSTAPAKLPPRLATLEDLLALPDQGRGYELIDGELVAKESSPLHGLAQTRVVQFLVPYSRRSGGGGPGGWWILTEQLVRFSGQVLRPDIAGWRCERLETLPVGPTLEVCPDWVCEIISPSNATNDTVRKKRLYHQHQVRHYWLVDPMREELTVLRWAPEGYLDVLTAGRSEHVHAEPFHDLPLHIGYLFGDDPA